MKKPIFLTVIILFLSGCLAELPSIQPEYMNPDGKIVTAQSADKDAVLLNPLSYIYEDHGETLTVTYVNGPKENFAVLELPGKPPLKLLQKRAWSKGAKYQSGEITWQTQGDSAIFIEQQHGRAFTKLRAIPPITEWDNETILPLKESLK